MADIKIPKSVPCLFEVSWVGRCNNPSTNGWCSKHENLKCCSCGAKATQDCDHTSSLVCGAPLCKTCHHSLAGDGHVTGAVYKEQTDKRKQEEDAIEQSRTNSEQRLDGEGNPANLFELLKKDPKEQGYRLEKVFYLQLTHGLMAFFPAVIDAEKRVIACLDRNLLVEVWKTLEPRASKMDSQICYVNEQKGIAYPNVDEQYEQERLKPEKIFTRNEYEGIQKKIPGAITWAPGLIGGQCFEAVHFSAYVDRMAATCP